MLASAQCSRAPNSHSVLGAVARWKKWPHLQVSRPQSPDWGKKNNQDFFLALKLGDGMPSSSPQVKQSWPDHLSVCQLPSGQSSACKSFCVDGPLEAKSRVSLQCHPQPAGQDESSIPEFCQREHKRIVQLGWEGLGASWMPVTSNLALYLGLFCSTLSCQSILYPVHCALNAADTVSLKYMPCLQRLSCKHR